MLTVTEAEDQTVAPEDVQEIISATVPVSVNVDEINAGPVKSGRGDSVSVNLDRMPPGYAVSSDGMSLLVRLVHVLSCADDEEDLLGEDGVTKIEVAHLLEFKLTQEIEVTPAAIAAFVETNAYFIAYPYVREVLTYVTSQMGMPPVVLGYMQREEWPYKESADNGDVES